jgi:hypothetical protein
MRLIEPARSARWGRSHPGAGDPPKRHHTRAKVGDPYPVPASSARSPKQAETVHVLVDVVQDLVQVLDAVGLADEEWMQGDAHDTPASGSFFGRSMIEL